MAWRALAWKAATLIEPGRELWASFVRSNEDCCVMKCVRVVGVWRVEAKGLTAFVVSVLRAGITRQVCRSIDGHMVDAILLLCNGKEMG